MQSWSNCWFCLTHWLFPVFVFNLVVCCLNLSVELLLLVQREKNKKSNVRQRLDTKCTLENQTASDFVLIVRKRQQTEKRLIKDVWNPMTMLCMLDQQHSYRWFSSTCMCVHSIRHLIEEMKTRRDEADDDDASGRHYEKMIHLSDKEILFLLSFWHTTKGNSFEH